MASKHREAGTPARRKRAPPYLARQMSRVETRTPGVTDVQLPDLFGSGVGAILAVSRMDTPGVGVSTILRRTRGFYPGSGHREMDPYVLHV